MATEALQIDALWAGLNDPDTGQSYSGAIVATFATDGVTPQAVWEDKAKTLPDAGGKFQFNLDANGQAEIFGDGVYVIKVYAPTDTGLLNPLQTYDGLTYSVSTSVDSFSHDHDTDGSHIVFYSLDNLRASTLIPFSEQVVKVTGFYSRAEHREWFFRWSASSTAADNSGVYIKLDSIATGRFVRLSDGHVSSSWFGSHHDGVTDSTSEILATASYVSGYTNDGLVYIPPNTVFDTETLLASTPANVVYMDMSVINDYSASTETNKKVGILSKDSAPNDTHFSVGSDHHSIMRLQNYGGAGSLSADERKASLLWATGDYQNGAANKKGFRPAAIKQFTKVTGADWWVETLRSSAPWLSIAGDWEWWVTGEVIPGVTYRANGGYQYVSASTGTCGGTPPTHSTGTVSDGGVDWTWIDSTDKTIYSIDQYGRFLIGPGASGDTFRIKVDNSDPAGSFVGSFRSTGISKDVVWTMHPTDSGGAEQVQPYISASATEGLQIKDYLGDVLMTFKNQVGLAPGYVKSEKRIDGWETAADGDTTPLISKPTLYLSNSGLTSIIRFDSATDGAYLEVISLNANSTLINSTTLMLEGGNNLTMGAYDVVRFRRVPSSISARWIETSRSIK